MPQPEIFSIIWSRERLGKNRVEHPDRNLSRVACGGITFLFRGHVAHQGGADFRCSYCRRYQARGREELPASRRFGACIATHSVLEYSLWQSRGNSRLRTSSAPALYDLLTSRSRLHTLRTVSAAAAKD